MTSQLDRLLRHMQWADERTAASIEGGAPSRRDAARLFAHIAMTESLYLKRVLGEDPFPQDFWPEMSLEEAVRLSDESAAGLRALVLGTDEAALAVKVRYRNSKGTYFETPLHEMITHLALHGEHHRGQIARIIREGGGEPALTDYIVFVREELS